MSDATATPELKPQPSLFTRLRAVEAELDVMKAELADLRVDRNALQNDRDEWRWRAERLLAERREGFFDRWEGRVAKAADLIVRRLNGALLARRPEGKDASPPQSYFGSAAPSSTSRRMTEL